MPARLDPMPTRVVPVRAGLLRLALALVASAPVIAATPSTATADSAAYNAAVTRDAPVSFWPLDDTAGPTVADARGRNAGTARGGVTFGEPGAMAGSTALRLDGNALV